MRIPKNKILISLTLITIIIFTSCINLPKENIEFNKMLEENQILKSEISELKKKIGKWSGKLWKFTPSSRNKIIILIEQKNFIKLADKEWIGKVLKL